MKHPKNIPNKPLAIATKLKTFPVIIAFVLFNYWFDKI